MSKIPSADQSPAAADKAGQEKTAGAAAPAKAPAAPTGPTATEVAKILKAKGVKVRVPKTNKDGVTTIINRAVGEDDVLSFRVSDDGHTLTAVTIDGQKYQFGDDE